MLLKELYEQLAIGELSQHKYGSSGAIRDADKPAIITQLNRGLTNLYSYFPISVEEVVIQQYDHITEYRINSKYAVSNVDSTEPYKWVRDSEANPFKDDLLRIDCAYDEAGNPVPLNNDNDANSAFNVRYDTLQIPFPNASNITVLIYRAKHEQILADSPEDTEIMVPPCLEEALMAFIAGRCFVSLGNAASAGLATYYTQRYQEQIQHVERHNLLYSSETDANTKLTRKGFI